MNIRSLRSSRAFTLIELLIVITIIGILAVALLPRITAGPAKARDAQRKADLQQLATAIALYADDNGGTYPYGSCIGALTTASGGSTLVSLTSYMTSVPTDPVSTNATIGCSGTAGVYAYWRTSTGFVLEATLETNTATGAGIYLSNTTVLSTTKIPLASPTSTAITNLTSYLCGTSTCTTSGLKAAYLLFR